ncbi:MAG: FxsA cytoplasmic rane protein, partial [Solirubrobacterales bacterium]|nr:FxsA cytoplasmic rane protein [Solirubrobacterales bacterium]
MPLLVLLFVVVPILELFVIIQVGGAIGVLPTIGLLLLDSVLGSVLMRSQGRAAWQRFQAATAAGKVPAREVVDGALVVFGGALLLSPGFLTDVLGLALLFPPTRAMVRRTLLGGVVKRMMGPAAIPGGMAFRFARGR